MNKDTVLLGTLELNKKKIRICIPVMEKTIEETIIEAMNAADSKPDLLEIRLDMLVEDQLEDVGDIFSVLRSNLPDLPLLATYRSQVEGGEGKMDSKDVYSLYRAIVKTECVEMVDLEMSMDPKVFKDALDFCKESGVATIASYHNFQATPSVDDMMSLFTKGERMGADISKIAVMPRTPSDLADLFTVCARAYVMLGIPYVGISMGSLGKLSRVGAGYFGSCMTFAAKNGKASAPGQLEAGELRVILDIMLDEDENE